MELSKSVCTNEGGCVIAEDVISKIAEKAALEIEGVHGLSKSPDTKFSFAKYRTEKPIRIFSKENEIFVTISIVIKSGYKIPEVAAKVQKSVTENIQNMAGKKVTKVNIRIDGINFEEVQQEQD